MPQEGTRGLARRPAPCRGCHQLLLCLLAEVDAWSKHHRALERVAAWSIILAKEQEIAVSISVSLSAVALTAKLLNSGDCGGYLAAMHHGVALQLLGCGGHSGSAPLPTNLPQAKQEQLGTSLPARHEAAEARVASYRDQLRAIERQMDELSHKLQVGGWSCLGG